MPWKPGRSRSPATAATRSRPTWPARPGGAPYGGMVVIHHLPGYDAGTKEIVRRFAANGYAALCPNLYSRQAPGASPDDAAAFVRAQGGIPRRAARRRRGRRRRHLRGLPGATGKVGVIGYCSGGRQTFLAACSLPLDAAVDCYGAFVVNEPPAEFPLAVHAAARARAAAVLPAARPLRRRRHVPLARGDRGAFGRARPAGQAARVPHLRRRRARVLLRRPARLPPRGRRRRLGQDLRLPRTHLAV